MSAVTKRPPQVAPWLKCLDRRSRPRVRLVCFPYAGGSYTAYRGWGDRLPAWVEVWRVCLPGHVGRLMEDAWTDLVALATEVADHILPDPAPVVLFGHSMGGLLAFEAARCLTRDGAPPLGLFVAGRAAPRNDLGHAPITDLDDDAFTREVQIRYGGLSEEIVRSPEIMELFLPVLRADIAMMEGYHPSPGPALSCPLHLLIGTGDSLTTHEQIQGWAQESTGPLRVHEFEGGHFFIDTARDTVLTCLADCLVRLC